jgi:hypothetical protein
MTDSNNMNDARSSSSGGSIKGISNKVIITLAVVAVLVTAIGAWAVLNSISSQNTAAEQQQENTNVGVITLNILPAGASQNQDSSGEVTVNIEKN